MRTRRGLSTVVGMVFAIIALSTTLVYITYSMNTLDQYDQTVLSKNQGLLNQDQEKPVLISATYSLNKFNITVTNTGNIPINFTKIWIQNTTATDKTWYFRLSNTLASPGGVLKNIGQNIPYTFPSSQTYNIKLVTSRGNSLQFFMNSVSSTPLNIQLSTMPPTLPSGFTTQLVMIVTNNSTGVLANVVPSNPIKQGSSTGSCTLGALNSNSYPTLQVGQTAIFSWPLTVSGTPGSTCTYKAQLQGSTQTVQATVTSTVVTLVPATTYSQYSGILTINYTSFRWAETGQITWHTGWQFANGGSKAGCGTTCAAFEINMTNNNSTGTFWVSKNTNLVYYNSHTSPSLQPTPFFLVNATNPTTMINTAYSNCNGQSDYCISIPPGVTVTLTFSALSAGSATGNGFPASDLEPAFLLVYGKFATTQTGSGTAYAQNIPYMSAVIT